MNSLDVGQQTPERSASSSPLYGHMSRRVMDTINRFVPVTDHYSIDEAFVDFDTGHQDDDAPH
jgi:nucleotidyltransferase/DNA polymerase involved in DNA repair